MKPSEWFITCLRGSDGLLDRSQNRCICLIRVIHCFTLLAEIQFVAEGLRHFVPNILASVRRTLFTSTKSKTLLLVVSD